MLKPTPNPSIMVKSKQKIMKGSDPIERNNFIGFVNINQIDIDKSMMFSIPDSNIVGDPTSQM